MPRKTLPPNLGTPLVTFNIDLSQLLASPPGSSNPSSSSAPSIPNLSSSPQVPPSALPNFDISQYCLGIEQLDDQGNPKGDQQIIDLANLVQEPKFSSKACGTVRDRELLLINLRERAAGYTLKHAQTFTDIQFLERLATQDILTYQMMRSFFKNIFAEDDSDQGQLIKDNLMALHHIFSKSQTTAAEKRNKIKLYEKVLTLKELIEVGEGLSNKKEKANHQKQCVQQFINIIHSIAVNPLIFNANLQNVKLQDDQASIEALLELQLDLYGLNFIKMTSQLFFMNLKALTELKLDDFEEVARDNMFKATVPPFQYIEGMNLSNKTAYKSELKRRLQKKPFDPDFLLLQYPPHHQKNVDLKKLIEYLAKMIDVYGQFNNMPQQVTQNGPEEVIQQLNVLKLFYQVFTYYICKLEDCKSATDEEMKNIHKQFKEVVAPFLKICERGEYEFPCGKQYQALKFTKMDPIRLNQMINNLKTKLQLSD